MEKKRFLPNSRKARSLVGLRKFLFLDRLYESSEKVRHGYKQQFQNSMKLLCLIVIPCFVLECVYKIWWYVWGASELPYYGNIYLSNTILCMLELISCLYQTTTFYLVCVLFRLVCHLQILRLQNFAQAFQEETEVELILMGTPQDQTEPPVDEPSVSHIHLVFSDHGYSKSAHFSGVGNKV